MNSRVVLITGASSGIGKALALRYAKAAWKLAINGRNEERLQAVATACLTAGATGCLVLPADVSKEEECRTMIQRCIGELGGIDVLINNAGITMRARFEESGSSVLHQVMNNNFWSAVYCSRYALPSILSRKGSLVGVSSIAGKKGLPGRAAYSSSKFAMEGLLEVIRNENIDRGLHVLVACPGFTASDIRKSGLNARGEAQGESPRDEAGMMSAEEVAERIFEAVKHRKRDLVLTREGKLTLWLNALFPSWMDKKVFEHLRKEPGSPF